ncbi:MAG TPA: transcriptional regulator [Paenibacillaceae bacterium]|nr:transcriptional regulator [Paenibacillaceae bacterium]
MDYEKICPKFEGAYELLGKKWTVLIIRVLMKGSHRFKDISNTIPGMSDRMLAERMKELEAAGIVLRHVYPETPVRIEYELSEKGLDLQAVLNEMQRWGEKWL